MLWDSSRPSCPPVTWPLLLLGLSFASGPLSGSAPGGSAASPGLVFCSAVGFGCWTGSGPSPGSCEGLLSWQWHRGQVSCTYSHFLRQPAWKKWLHGVITAVFISWKTQKKKEDHIICDFILFLSPHVSNGSISHRRDWSSLQVNKRMFLPSYQQASTFKYKHRPGLAVYTTRIRN